MALPRPPAASVARAAAAVIALAMLAGCTGGPGSPATGPGASPSPGPGLAASWQAPGPTGLPVAERDRLALAAANATPEARAFLSLYPGARAEVVEVGGCAAASELAGRALECSPGLDAGRRLLAVYWVGPGWSGPRATAVKVGLDAATLEAGYRRPPMAFLEDPRRCEADGECAVHVHGCSCTNVIWKLHVPPGVEAETCSPDALALGCACVAGSCAPAGGGSEVPAPAVTASTDRASYAPGEAVTIALANGMASPIYAHQGALAIEAVERQGPGGDWEGADASCRYPHCVYDIGPPDEVPPGRSASIVWRQLVYVNGTRLVAAPGTYRIEVRFQTREGGDPGAWDWRVATTNEFELRAA